MRKAEAQRFASTDDASNAFIVCASPCAGLLPISVTLLLPPFPAASLTPAAFAAEHPAQCRNRLANGQHAAAREGWIHLLRCLEGV
jgi:hypothetical protein